MATKVYQYGARAPLDLDLAMAHMRAGHDYYNDLIAAERRRRTAAADLGKTSAVLALEAEFSEADAVLEANVALAASERRRCGERVHALAAQRSTLEPAEWRRRSAVLADEKRQTAAAAKVRRAALADRRADVLSRLRVAREAGRTPAIRERLAEVEERCRLERLDAYAKRPCFWGTKLIVQRAADAAIEASRKFRKGEPPPAPPSFRRWSGEGTIGVQIQAAQQGRLGNIFRVEMLPALSDSRRAQLRRRAIVSIRVGSTEEREPVWVRVPVLFHRPLPDGAAIKWVALHRRLVGGQERWLLDVTVGTDDAPANGLSSSVGVDFGWRRVDGGIRVAMVATESTVLTAPESAREFVVPDRIASRFDHADSLRSIRDRNMDTMRDTLRAYIAGLPRPLPEWMLALKVEHMHSWKSPRHFVHLCRSWQRHAGDGFAWTALEAWRRQDKHLWQWEANEREGAALARRDLFRRWAHQLATTNGVIAVEDVALDTLAVRQPGRGPAEAAASALRFVAAPGELRTAIVQAARTHGAEVRKVSAGGTTRTCHGCGHAAPLADPKALMQQCAGCGVVWDQDVNAALNIRASGLVTEAVTVAKRAGRWQRLKAQKEERSKRRDEGGEGDADAA